ncbi:MAG: hypothetical protein Q8K68_09235, partial [Nitrospirota bacterium]|nr:hypothetical protein [Nitrospirota bacterium]
MSEITLPEVKEAFEYLRDKQKDGYPKLRVKQHEEETYYDQSFKAFKDDKYISHEIKMPWGRDLVDSPADSLAMDSIKVHMAPQLNTRAQETQQATASANKNEAWCQAVIDSCARRQPYYLRDTAKQIPLRGESWLNINCDWSYKDDPEKYQGNP